MIPNTPAILEELIGNLSNEELGRKPGRDRFCIAEVIAHLEHAERTLYGPRLRTLMAKERPALPAYQSPAGGFAGRDSRTTLESYRQEREANAKLLAGLDSADLQRTGMHEVYGPLTLENVISEIAYHDLGHIKQVCELLRWLRFHPKMGPFQKDYSVHP